MHADTISLPERIGEWRLAAPPRRIDKTNIFEYMNGAGELYLSYNFHHLTASTYTDTSGNEILVELYRMDASRDAFGLLSLDWGGEPVDIGGVPGETSDTSDTSGKGIVPSSRALYGAGLLRAWADTVYLRIMAYKETPESKNAILALGKMIAEGRKNPSPPELLGVVPLSMDAHWQVREDRTAYFYSHLVLNTIFYLSHENILNLNHSTEVLMITVEKAQHGEPKQSVPLLVIKYPDPARALAALTEFKGAYLPDRHTKSHLETGSDHQAYVPVEDGWLGYRLHGRYLALVFKCPDPESARRILGFAVFQ